MEASMVDFQHNTIFMSTQQGIFQLYHLSNAIIANNVFYSVGSASQPIFVGLDSRQLVHRRNCFRYAYTASY